MGHERVLGICVPGIRLAQLIHQLRKPLALEGEAGANLFSC